MSKEISLDSRFEDIFNSRNDNKSFYKRLGRIAETDTSFPEIHPLPTDNFNLGFEDDKSYTPNDVAAILQVKPATVRRWIREEELPATRVGKKLLFVSGADVKGILELHGRTDNSS